MYITDKFSNCEFNQSKDCVWYWDTYIEFWLEEIELPSEEEILNEAKDRNQFLKLGLIKGANFILNKLKGENK